MNSKHLHIVALDVPFPPDYGGVIDIYYRCKALTEAGYNITLHCFEYGRGTHHSFEGIASEVFYYPRKKRLIDWFSSEPFIVRSRASKQLLERLLSDEDPILFEGQHTTRYLDHPALAPRKKMVRIHNIEWQYYEALARRTDSLFKRLFFRSEARKLKRQETIFKHANTLACLSHTDQAYYTKHHPNAVYLAAAIEFSPVKPNPGGYALFHGNLGVAENEEAAYWLLENWHTDFPLRIAGKQPSPLLEHTIAANPFVSLVANPDQASMETLISGANVHLLITFQQSGIKLKLLNALYSGVPCIATPQMVAGTNLGQYCTMISSEEELMQLVTSIDSLPDGEIDQRRAAIQAEFGSKKSVEMIQRELFG